VLSNRPPDYAGAQHGPNRPDLKLEQSSDPGNAQTAQGLKQSSAPSVSPPIVARQPIALAANRQWDDNFTSQVTPRGDKFILPRGFPCNFFPRRHSKVAYHRILRGGRSNHPAFPNPAEHIRANPNRGQKFMKNQLNAVLLSAALAGLAGGSAVAAHAATQTSANANSAKVMRAGLRYSGSNYDTAKHSCKGKNDCKGQGGCKSGDNGCSGKNSCKGKGGCATDGSQMPGLV